MRGEGGGRKLKAGGGGGGMTRTVWSKRWGGGHDTTAKVVEAEAVLLSPQPTKASTITSTGSRWAAGGMKERHGIGRAKGREGECERVSQRGGKGGPGCMGVANLFFIAISFVLAEKKKFKINYSFSTLITFICTSTMRPELP
jgi:hypothetical protein